MTLSLLSTKFNLPPLGANIVHRPRLLRMLDEGLAQGAALTLVCSPAGYGKTTLVSEWLRASPAIPSDRFAWLTLESGDDDLTRFLTYLVTALQRIHPGIGASLLSLLQTHKPSPVPVLATMLINELNDVRQRFFLVLDDVHLLTAEAIQNFIAFLVEHQPPSLHLVLLTRADPALPLARLRARGQLLEIRQEALCFLPTEVAEFTNRMMDLALPPEQVSFLAQKTEGWVSGLQLAALSLRTASDRSAFFTLFSGEHEFIADYLTDEVLARLPEDARSFLLHTSILERFSAPLCEAVSRQTNAQATLERLLDAGLFIVPLDSQHAWYRYHNLFADLLRKRLQTTQPELVPALHQRASQWFEQNSLPDHAIEHAIAASDYQRAARLIEGQAERLLRYGEAASLLRWLEALPEDQILANPLLGAIYGIALILCARSIRLVAALVEKMSAAGSLDELRGETSMLHALLAVYQGDAPRAIQLSELALQRLPAERPFFRSLAADTLGMGYTLAWDIPAATRAFEQVVEISRQSDNVLMAIMALTNLAGLCYVHGQLRTAIAACQQVLEMARQRIGTQTPMIGKTLFNLGEMLREQGDLETALNHLLEAARMMEIYSEVGQPIANLAIARVYMNKQNWPAALSYIAKARQKAQATQSLLMDDRLVEVMQARYSLARGDVDQAAQWALGRGFLERSAADIFAEESRHAASYEVFQAECLVLARLLLAQAQPERALEFLVRLQDLAEKRNHQRRLIEILALKALALHQQGELDHALQALEKAFSMAEPEGYQRTFIDEGEPMARLLYQAAARGIAPGYAGTLLAVLSEQSQSLKPIAQSSSANLIEPLSERELQVLRLIADGLSNNEIAGRLYITLSTVKGHASNIFGKLGVKNRTQAVAQARSLGLLPPG